MNEDFVSFSLAKKLKEKGFPQYTEKSYFVGDHKKRMCSVGTFLHVHTQNTEHLIAAPTIAQVLKWLRKEKKMNVNMPLLVENGWYFSIQDYMGVLRYSILQDAKDTDDLYSSYEAAAIAGIEYVIDNLI